MRFGGAVDKRELLRQPMSGGDRFQKVLSAMVIAELYCPPGEQDIMLRYRGKVNVKQHHI